MAIRQSYAQDLRDRVLAAVDGGMAVRQVAARFRVSVAYVYKALIRRRLTGESGVNPNRGRPPRKLSPAQDLALAAHIRSRPGITLAQAQAWLPAEHGVEISTGAMWNAAKRRGLSFKKALRAAEQDRPDVAARRKLWRAAQPFIDPEALIFLDETGLNTKRARLYGWAPVGERCRDSAPFGHGKTMTFIAGLRLAGITAPWLLDGAMDGDALRTYARHVLAPTLRRGDVVVLDHPARAQARRRARSDHGAASPDLLPAALRPGHEPDRNGIPSSRRCCARSRRGPSTVSSSVSANCAIASSPSNAPTTSMPRDINGHRENALAG